MGTTNSTNMSLPVPGVGTEAGPTYASDINSCLTLIDQHDHSPGRGVQVTPAGLNINADLTMANSSLTNIKSLVLTNQTSVSTLQALYVATGSEVPTTNDLWFNDGNGNAIQITSGGTVNASIASLPGENYSAGTFFWKQGAGSTTPANFDIGSITIRPNTAGTANGIVMSPPAGIGSQYSLVLPLLPAANKFLALDASGNITTTVNVAAGLTASNISASAGILGSQLSATAGITGSQIASATITQGNMGVGSIDGLNSGAGGQIIDQSIVGSSIALGTIDPSNCISVGTTGTYAGATLGVGTTTIFSGSVGGVKNRPLMFMFKNTVAAGGTIAGPCVINFTFNGTTFNSMTVPSGTHPMSAFNCIYFSGSTVSTFLYSVSITVAGGSCVVGASKLDVVPV